MLITANITIECDTAEQRDAIIQQLESDPTATVVAVSGLTITLTQINTADDY